MSWNEVRKKIRIGTIGLWVIFAITTIVMFALIFGGVFQPYDYWISVIAVGTLLILSIAATVVDVKSESRIKMGIVGIWTIFALTLVIFAALIYGGVFEPSGYWIPMIPIGTLLVLAIVPTVLEYTSGEVRFCPKCGKIFARKGGFCQECGTRILMTCPSCGTKIKGNPKFCFKCGLNLSEEEVIQTPPSQIRFKAEGYTETCGQCGAPAKPEAKYCVFCGFQLS
ncbi:MAG: zinc ribbon domain-containing protein [Candidatus Thorarchaeota archaeon]